MAPISIHMPLPVIAQYVFFVTIGIWYEISRRDIFRNVDAVILALQETVFGHPHGTEKYRAESQVCKRRLRAGPAKD